MLSVTALKQTPLHDQHNQLKAKMVPFGGWEMPLQYEGILAEYEATRKRTAVFDTSHMGEFYLRGEVEKSGLEAIVSQRLCDMRVGQCRYGVMPNLDGGVIDDLIVYRLDTAVWMIVVNAGNIDGDAQHIQRLLKPGTDFENASMAVGKLDIQGPGSRELLSDFVPGLETLKYYTARQVKILGCLATVSRTGYTGELGYEIYFPWQRMGELWEKIIKLGAQPAGLGARDILRLEMGYSLYGHELCATISPLEAGLEKFVDWEKDFLGKQALQVQKAKGLKREIIGFISQTRRSPRQDLNIYAVSGQEIGKVTSGSFSPALERGIGLGLIEHGLVKTADQIFIGENFKQVLAANIASRPFYKQGTFRQ